LLPLGRDWIRSPRPMASPQTPQTDAYLAVIATRLAYGVAAAQRGMAMRRSLTGQYAQCPLRRLTGDPPRHAHRATAFPAGQSELILIYLALAELVDVLMSYCERPRGEIGRKVCGNLLPPRQLPGCSRPGWAPGRGWALKHHLSRC
jgi:hypothetical protein